jgi:hypothetical protein
MTIFDIAFHLQASKNRQYQNSTLIIFEGIATFLTQHSFAKDNLLERFRQNPREFKVTDTDMTEDGMTWLRQHSDRCLKNIDRQKGPRIVEGIIMTLEKTIK